MRLVLRAARNPNRWKLSSYALQSAKPPITGTNELITQNPAVSLRINQVSNTVKNGAELFTVSVKLTEMYFRAISPITTVRNLKPIYSTTTNTRQSWYISYLTAYSQPLPYCAKNPTADLFVRFSRKDHTGCASKRQL